MVHLLRTSQNTRHFVYIVLFNFPTIPGVGVTCTTLKLRKWKQRGWVLAQSHLVSTVLLHTHIPSQATEKVEEYKHVWVCVCVCAYVFSLPKQLKKQRSSLSWDQLEIFLLSILANRNATLDPEEENDLSFADQQQKLEPLKWPTVLYSQPFPDARGV